jgi:hypothetical protein
MNWKGCGKKEILFRFLPGAPRETTKNIINTE